MGEVKESLNYTKEFKEMFEKELCYKNGLNMHSAWADLMKLFACDLSNLTEGRKDIKEKRIKDFKECAKRLGGIEIPLKLFDLMTKALWTDPAQDFLGTIYMNLGGNKGTGQFFTPYNVGWMMAHMNLMDADEVIKEKGYISTADPSSGSGILLLTQANVLREKGYNTSTQALFCGQDIDETCTCMTYIQLALTGCAAVIKCGNTLTDPFTGNPLFVKENDDTYWYTPMFYLPEWNKRRKEIIEERKLNKLKRAS